ncbi:dimethylsulfonioproprionate lyase family protein [Palleronia sp. KMU-117]|uniref:dimethylsulfonioproprionate lyase family protein n=1 Tax=Palleronia sp. KMU-117 TaxID=3434108 RepID=UPI003D714640
MRDWSAVDLRQLRLLRAPVGTPGAARARYGAAMHFYQRGAMSARALEVYRICATRDLDDPAALLRTRGIADRLPPAPKFRPDLAVEDLIDEADLYLSGLGGPGISEARALLARGRGLPVATGRSRNRVVAAHLPAALDALAATHPTLALAIRLAAPHLPWNTYDYDDPAIGPHFPKAHAFCSILGEDGAAIRVEGMDFGLFLVAPHVLYRDHAHAAPELYAPLTGPHGWRFAPDAPLVLRPAHRPVWNVPHAAHLIKVGPVPFLCLFAWTADIASPAYVLPASDWDRLDTLRLETPG